MADCSSEDEEDFVSEDKLLVVDSEGKWKELMCIEFPGIFFTTFTTVFKYSWEPVIILSER